VLLFVVAVVVRPPGGAACGASMRVNAVTDMLLVRVAACHSQRSASFYSSVYWNTVYWTAILCNVASV